jgi:two-component system, chemotaxis family, chemotaxis protein CheY
MKRCLIADDSAIIRKVARQMLEQMNFEVLEAENGLEAIDRCKSDAPDVVLLDWQMPIHGAMDFLALLRKQTSGPRPQVIYCITENDPVDISRAFAAGADNYLMKPYNRQMLKTKLTETIGAI